MLGTLLFSPGDVVFIEDPTYFTSIKILRDDLRLKCVSGIFILFAKDSS